MKTKKAELYNSSIIDEVLNSIDPVEANRIEKRMLLAAKIEDAMKTQGLSKSQFAILMDQKNSVITKWLSGTHNFTIDTLFDIDMVLNMNLIVLDKPKESFVTVYRGVAQSTSLNQQKAFKIFPKENVPISTYFFRFEPSYTENFVATK